MFRFRRAGASQVSKTYRYQDFLVHLIPEEQMPRDERGFYGLRASLSKIDSPVVQTFDHLRFVATAREAQLLSLEFAKQLIDNRQLPTALL